MNQVAEIIREGSVKILYIGNSLSSSTSRHRHDALGRLGHSLEAFDPYLHSGLTNGGRLFRALHYRTGYIHLQRKILSIISELLPIERKFDLVWVDSGELVGPEVLSSLRRRAKASILFNHDDPSGDCYGRRFASLLHAISAYDVVTAVRDQSLFELSRLTNGKTVRIWRTYDEIEHRPLETPTTSYSAFESDISFVGTWFNNENRDLFLLEIVKAGLNVSIWGNRWEKSPYWKQIKPHHRGPSLSGREYVAAISQSKCTLGMTASISRDEHTTRSMEIPYAGGVFCAKRTNEHSFLYKEGIEALFWDDPKECIYQCKRLIEDSSLRDSIRIAGMKRVRANQVGNEDVCRLILASL